ncbi:MAG: hypothetical protein JO356_19710 [Acidobacteria bacterium]|nr:hypothetical protein [Acidobacteriota bacterium]
MRVKTGTITASLFFVLSATALRVGAQTPMIPPCKGQFRWILNAGSLKRSQPQFPLDLQRKYFDSACTFLVIGGAGPPDYRDWKATRTRTVTELRAVDEVADDPVAVAILYDPEAWEMTPTEEQAHPAEAVCRAAPIVHSHNKLLIVTPATNLIRVISPSAVLGGDRFRAFAKTNLAGNIAKCSDVYEIQAQGAEADLQKFRSFVTTEAEQARAANPAITVLAGISTNPMGNRVSSGQLFKAVQSVRSVIDGFWLNIPEGGKYCPSCGEAQPQVALQLMQMLNSK